MPGSVSDIRAAGALGDDLKVIRDERQISANIDASVSSKLSVLASDHTLSGVTLSQETVDAAMDALFAAVTGPTDGELDTATRSLIDAGGKSTANIIIAIEVIEKGIGVWVSANLPANDV